jgi:hypothetical protein
LLALHSGKHFGYVKEKFGYFMTEKMKQIFLEHNLVFKGISVIKLISTLYMCHILRQMTMGIVTKLIPYVYHMFSSSLVYSKMEEIRILYNPSTQEAEAGRS